MRAFVKVRDGEGAVASVRGARAPHFARPALDRGLVAFDRLRPPLPQALDSRKRRDYSIMRIWTIGHSTRAIDEFISLLKENEIKLLADVRAWPGSKRYPQFNKDALTESLTAHGMRYGHFPELGGKRKSKPDSRNTAWRNASFRGYADYMQTEQFQNGIVRLLYTASEAGPIAIMCAEAVWWRCHRSLISDYLKARGLEVLHILGANKVEPHPYTSAARIVNGELSYAADSLL
jgi:uncharacterized protein (DUF488 family)